MSMVKRSVFSKVLLVTNIRKPMKLAESNKQEFFYKDVRSSSEPNRRKHIRASFDSVLLSTFAFSFSPQTSWFGFFLQMTTMAPKCMSEPSSGAD